MKKIDYKLEDFYFLRVSNMWNYFKTQHFAYWMICGYIFFEFVKPQSLYPSLAVIPWAQLLLMLAAVGFFMDGSVRMVRTSANILVGGFTILIFVSIAAALYPDVSRENFVSFFSWVVIYFLSINIVNTRERFYLFLMIYILAAGKIAIGTTRAWVSRGFSFQDWGLMGPTGYFQNSGELAILMVMLFPLTYYLYMALKSNVRSWEKWILLLICICPVMTTMGASSRGSQVALAVQLGVMFWRSLIKPKAFIGIAALVVGLWAILPPEQKQRFTDAGDDQTSQQRLLYWENGWEMMKEYPWTGVGYFNFIPHYELFYPEDMLYKTAQLPHNIFIQVGTDAGFITLFLFMLIILYCMIKPYQMIKKLPQNMKVERAIMAGLGIGVLGYLIAGQFVTVTYYPFIWIHLTFIVIGSKVFTNNNKQSIKGL